MRKFDPEREFFGGTEKIPKHNAEKECEDGHGLWTEIKVKAPKLKGFKRDIRENLDGARDLTRSNASPHGRSHLLSSSIAGGLHASQSNSFITSWRKETNRDLGQRPFEPATSVCPGAGAALQSPPNLPCYP
uniref:Uncharacterized protein n=1 Tax=Sphaerodactylus townsendi TaxID=933632 RepID=A0ACB8EFK5_9SAUR